MTRTTPTGVEAKRQATLLANFMKARHNIYLKKQAGKPRPWTDDWVLDTFRFCNVYRELDTVTEWVATNIRKPFADSPHLWWMLAAARQINWPGTLQALIEQPKSAKAWPHNQRGAPAFDPAAMVRVLDARKAAKLQVFTGAYIITNNGISMPKANYVAERVLAPLAASKPPDFGMGSMQEAHTWLRQHMGFGGFMAYEVVCDMRWCPQYGYAWADTMTWAHAGPGALRGLNRLAGVDKDAPMPEAHALELMRVLLAGVQKQWPKAWPKLEMREIEHSLCEYDKWCRAHADEGRPRSKYTPSTGSNFV